MHYIDKRKSKLDKHAYTQEMIHHIYTIEKLTITGVVNITAENVSVYSENNKVKVQDMVEYGGQLRFHNTALPIHPKLKDRFIDRIFSCHSYKHVKLYFEILSDGRFRVASRCNNRTFDVFMDTISGISLNWYTYEIPTY